MEPAAERRRRWLDIDPALTFLEQNDAVVQVAWMTSARGARYPRRFRYAHVKTAERRDCHCHHRLRPADGAVRRVARAAGRVSRQTTTMRLALHAGLDGKVHRHRAASMLIRFAREWASTAELTNGKCTVIIGAGVNHWYHANLMYRAAIHALMFCGCVGVNGGGLAHYVGQEKLAPGEPWSAIAFGRDWMPAAAAAECAQLALCAYRPVALRARLYRLPYGSAGQRNGRPRRIGPWTHHGRAGARRCARDGCRSIRSFEAARWKWCEDAEAAGAKSDEAVVNYAVEQLKDRKLKFSVEDPDAPENWPRYGSSGAAMR